MARLINVNTGVVVHVDDAKVSRLGSEWSEDGEALRDAPSHSATPDESWTVKDLKAYADENDIDLGGATKKFDILAEIAAASEDEDSDDDSDGSDDDESVDSDEDSDDED